MRNFKIGVGAVQINKRGVNFLNQVISHNRLSYGKFTERFEKEFARLHSRRFAIFCNSGTSALQVSFHVLKRKYNWKEGSEIIVPALTFVASINTILQNNLKPVFVDIDPLYFGMDPLQIENKITVKTVGLEPVHLFGQPADMEPIMTIANNHHIKVIEDSCETMFAKYKGKAIGSFGDISCFSTYAAHLIVTGVGGFATTNDQELAIAFKSLFNHGRDGIYLHIDDDNQVTNKKLQMIVERRFNFTDIGYSYRATEMEAALGLAQLATWKTMIAKRQKNAAYLSKNLSKFEEFIQVPAIRQDSEHVFMVYPIVVKEKRIDAKDLIFYLEGKGVETRYLLPTLTQTVYIKVFGNIAKDYPKALYASQHGFYIGCHQELTQADLDYILEQFEDFFKKYAKI